MRIHVQNPANEILFAITPQQWEAAVARHPDMAGHSVTFANDAEGLTRALTDAEALFTWTRVVRDTLAKGGLPEAAPALRVIFCNSAGLDALAPFAWLPDSLALLNNRGVHAEKAGEFGIMALLMLANHMPFFAAEQRAGRWNPRFGSSVAGRRLGVVGLGALGGAVAKRAQQFGMRVTGISRGGAAHEACERVVRQDALDSVLPELEFLVLACPLTPETRGLLDRRRMELMPKGGKIVNIGRGPIWDQDAACDLLESGHLSGCVTDVTVPEPLPAEHRLWSTPGMTVTPHMSADDPEVYNDRSLDVFFENLRADLAGKPWPNRVHPSRGY
jgi:phosphoglycerate dehydrogenase-like enzyme